MGADPTQRFSSRVENYVKYRPTYPPAVVEVLKDECGLTRDALVADVGSGTGLLSELFLKNGNRVYGVEPNREMREAGARLLKDDANFVSVDGRAEATTLDDRSVDFIVAGQAFHWFDGEKTRAEFRRILKPGGWVVLVWNERRIGASAFSEAYAGLFKIYGTDYERVAHRYTGNEMVQPFFGEHEVALKIFDNRQVFDFEGLKGRLLSASYTPEPDHPDFQPMIDELQRIFSEHQSAGQISIEYDTKVYYGQLK